MRWLSTVSDIFAGLLKNHWKLKRLPCANTYAYICRHLDVLELNEQILSYFSDEKPAPSQEVIAATDESMEERVHWAIDGKVLRGSAQHTPATQNGQELLHVYAVKAGYLEHCQMIESKGYEAATAQRFIAEHDCTGKIITADALHTRPRFCRQIRRQQGDYLLLVKRNRAELEAEIRQLFVLTRSILCSV